ncbi:MAG: cysteine--tRNA ligase [Deltaproteobacteria bacterium]|nr:cysteine--tRNA ligase [Deltaproteobacteria bacterium]
MTLAIYNTFTRRKETFEPIKPGEVKMYVCGITSYDECHLGHARAAIVFDIVYRYLKYLGYEVSYVRNFTDVDDKIIKKANDAKTSCEAIAEKYIVSYSEAMAQLGVQSPTIEPRASQHIAEMLHLIDSLEKKGFAYVAGTDVVYPVRQFPGYGKLSHKKIDELESGARVDVDEKKKDPLDFVLWKGSKPEEPKWPSRWGEGRPGWHIECSAMSMKYLGESFDIHGGGRDLIFPHHENEIAQSEAVTGVSFVRYWIHNGFVNIDQEKMSKSLGNIRTIPEILKKWSPESVRLFLLSTHYRSPLNFTETSLSEAEEAVRRGYETLLRLKKHPEGETALPEPHLLSHFSKYMDDDFNSAQFIGTLFNKIRHLNSWLDKTPDVEAESRTDFFEQLKKIGSILGIFDKDPEQYLQAKKESRVSTLGLSPQEIEKKILARQEARSQKDWKAADVIRQELAQKGVELKDNPDGTTSWSVRATPQ